MCQLPNIFQLAVHGKKIHSKCKRNQWILKYHIYRFLEISGNVNFKTEISWSQEHNVRCFFKNNFCLCICRVCTSFWFAPCFYILFNVHIYMCANVCGGVCESVSVHACVFSQRPERMFCTVMHFLYCLRTWSLTEPEPHRFFRWDIVCLPPISPHC